MLSQVTFHVKESHIIVTMCVQLWIILYLCVEYAQSPSLEKEQTSENHVLKNYFLSFFNAT